MAAQRPSVTRASPLLDPHQGSTGIRIAKPLLDAMAGTLSLLKMCIVISVGGLAEPFTPLLILPTCGEMCLPGAEAPDVSWSRAFCARCF